VLPPARIPARAICPWCELPGAHGGAEECVAALEAEIKIEQRRVEALTLTACARPPPPVSHHPKTVVFVVRRLIGGGETLVVYRSASLHAVWNWLRKPRGERVARRYYIEDALARASRPRPHGRRRRTLGRPAAPAA
jgi:hypothetical protein